MNFYHSTHRHYCGIDLHAPASLNVLKTIPGVGRILALTTLYE